MNRIGLILIFFFWLNFSSFAQSQKIVKQKEAVLELSKSLEEGKSDDLLAVDYENLAKELAANKEYIKAEENYIKAKNLYVKLKNKEKVALIERELAKLNEAQNRIDDAITNYQLASKISENKNRQEINQSDVQRLMNQSNSVAQTKYISQKIELLEDADSLKSGEISDAYVQMAQVNLEQNEPEKAIENYEIALKKLEKTEDKIEITKKIANIYASNQQLEKAIELKEQILEKAQTANDSRLEIEQLQNLSTAYFAASNEEKGIELLMDAYNLALENGHTLESKQSMELLTDYYRKTKQEKQALLIYSDFISKLELLIKSDSSLVDSKIFQVNEEKIAQLEKERALTDELIKKKNSFNYFLLFIILLILTLLFFIVRSLLNIRVKNKKIALQSLRREMNPHFIFNSLNSVNQFIAQNNELEANKYLSSYSKLMRNIMENSNKDFIPLSVELDQMKEYLQLEHLRFGEKFSYTIDVDENLDTDAVLFPNMLIQPQLENAIWHGLRYKNEKGYLSLKITKESDSLFVTIEDNGIGIEESKKLKTVRQKEHKSIGLSNTYDRIELLNNLYHTKIRLSVNEKMGEERGVIVIIQISLR